VLIVSNGKFIIPEDLERKLESYASVRI